MFRDNGVQELARHGGAGQMTVQPQRPSLPSECRRLSDRVGASKDLTVSVDQMDRFLQLAPRKLGIQIGDHRILKWNHIDAFTPAGAPPRQPVPAEATVAVEDENRL